MQIDSCLILSAGLGTRMGEIGKLLPKPLWPLYEKTLLDYHISVAQNIGCKTIYINTHHLSVQIESHIKRTYSSSCNIKLIHEPSLLDVGGSVINVSTLSGGLMLVINSDVVVTNLEELVQNISDKVLQEPVILFAVKVEDKAQYNRLIIKDNYLQGISTNNENKYTYTGMSIVNLDSVPRSLNGRQNFFTSVANPLTHKIWCIKLDDKSEYWDFGTKDLYCENLRKIFIHQSKLTTKLICEKFLDPHKIDYAKQSYGRSRGMRNVNCSWSEVTGDNNILLSTKKTEIEISNSIIFNENFDTIE